MSRWHTGSDLRAFKRNSMLMTSILQTSSPWPFTKSQWPLTLYVYVLLKSTCFLGKMINNWSVTSLTLFASCLNFNVNFSSKCLCVCVRVHMYVYMCCVCVYTYTGIFALRWEHFGCHSIPDLLIAFRQLRPTQKVVVIPWSASCLFLSW